MLALHQEGCMDENGGHMYNGGSYPPTNGDQVRTTAPRRFSGRLTADALILFKKYIY